MTSICELQYSINFTWAQSLSKQLTSSVPVLSKDVSAMKTPSHGE